MFGSVAVGLAGRFNGDSGRANDFTSHWHVGPAGADLQPHDNRFPHDGGAGAGPAAALCRGRARPRAAYDGRDRPGRSPFRGRRDGRATQVVCSQRGKVALKTAHGGASGGNDDDGV